MIRMTHTSSTEIAAVSKEAAVPTGICVLAGKLYKSLCYHTHTYLLSKDSSDIQKSLLFLRVSFFSLERYINLFVLIHTHTSWARTAAIPKRACCIYKYPCSCRKAISISLLSYTHIPPERGQQRHPNMRLLLCMIAVKLCHSYYTHLLSKDSHDIQRGGYSYEYPYSYLKDM